MNSTEDIDMIQEIDDELDEDIETKIVIKHTNVGTNSKHITEEQLYSLYQCFNINFDDLERKYCNWRLNVIHIRGVQQMSSDDILSYFNDYEPNSIEWVNDLSCNIVFNNEKCAAIAMIALTTAIVLKSVKQNITIDFGVEVIDADTLQVPVPPSFIWRLGKHHPKAKALLLRFAVKTDRKTKLSPQTVRDAVKRNVQQIDEINDKNDFVINAKRMRMRADEEEVLIMNKKRLTTQSLPKQHEIVVEERKSKSIWDRLDNDDQGNYCAVDADLLELAVNNQLKFKRNNVWNRLNYKPNRKINRNDLRNKLSNV